MRIHVTTLRRYLHSGLRNRKRDKMKIDPPSVYWAGKHCTVFHVEGDTEDYMLVTLVIPSTYDFFKMREFIHDIEGDSPEFAAFIQKAYNDCWWGK
jgi:hypothetical protein